MNAGSPEARGARVSLAGWVGALVVAIAVFSWLGEGRLGAPALTQPTAWPEWFREREPVEVLFAMGRLLVLGLAWYLVGVTTLAVVARWARSLRLLRVADALAVPSVRRILQASLGLGLATAAVASSTAQVARPMPVPMAGGPGVVAVAVGEADRPTPTPSPSATPTPVPTPALTEEEAEAGTDVASDDPVWHVTPQGEEAPQVDAPPEVAVAPQGDVAGLADASAAEYVVAPGDHFWSIAERVVTAHLGRAAADAEVDPYWRLLIAANQEDLVSPGDPDLILPGQRFVLPALGT